MKALDPGHGLTEVYVQARGRRFRTVQAGTGPVTVVFESGLAAGASVWIDVQRRVAEHTATLSYDRAGIGGSDATSDSRLLIDIVDDLEAVLEAAGVTGPIVIVGHGWGGPITRTFALSTKRTIVGCTLIECTLAAALDEDRCQGMHANFRLLSLLSWLGLHRRLRHEMLEDAASASSKADAAVVRRDLYAARAMRAGERECRGLTTEFGRLTELRAKGLPLGVPAVMICGTAEEPNTPELRLPYNAAAEAEADAVGARFVLAEGARHDLPQQRPDLVAEAILSLVRV